MNVKRVAGRDIDQGWWVSSADYAALEAEHAKCAKVIFQAGSRNGELMLERDALKREVEMLRELEVYARAHLIPVGPKLWQIYARLNALRAEKP